MSRAVLPWGGEVSRRGTFSAAAPGSAAPRASRAPDACRCHCSGQTGLRYEPTDESPALRMSGPWTDPPAGWTRRGARAERRPAPDRSRWTRSRAGVKRKTRFLRENRWHRGARP
ncbi:protein of unknown function [Methylorubrum extorquens]|uniref:Uncharacterized protein n=1 Tax=Methylorubrum extorquens TaxID=408 RepID=A0A2N9AWK5_METEX|nr:protein of unknown function [Methylorubrum extorquens]